MTQSRVLVAWTERWLFGHRRLVLVLFALATLFLGYHAAQVKVETSYFKMIPQAHPYSRNFLQYFDDLRPLGNVLRVSVANRTGDIYDAKYLETLRRVSDAVFYVPGVDRGNMKSLWTPNATWVEMTEDGLRGGTMIPSTYRGRPEDVEQVRRNVMRSGAVGSLVALDESAAMIVAPLLDRDPQTGDPLDYGKLSDALEETVRAAFESDQVEIQIIGFAKVVGDLIAGTKYIAGFFALSVLLTTLCLYAFCRCPRSTAMTILCCLIAVIWQVGIVQLMGYAIDPYSILVPFLTFAIGVSHALQNVNTMAIERSRGANDADAARATFSQLFVPGAVALLCDVVGFSTLLVIDIGVIKELAIAASIGVAVIIFTKMLLLPVLMSYVGVAPAAVARQQARNQHPSPIFRRIAALADPGRAQVVFVAFLALLAVGWWVSRDVKIGDLDQGAPELRADSRYNRDNAKIVAAYSANTDVFVSMVTTAPGECGSYPVATLVDRLQWELENLPGVVDTLSLFGPMQFAIAGANGGNLKWHSITRNRFAANGVFRQIPSSLFNTDCSMLPVIAYLHDHKADTLAQTLAAVEAFATDNAPQDKSDPRILLAAGSAGVEAITNRVIESASVEMLIWVYAIVSLLVLLEFRSLRVTAAIVFPLFVTSVLCEALMAALGLGIKVATLPVIALGVGIGVDYGIYLYNALSRHLARGLSLAEAYEATLNTTGRAIIFTGLTLALGVVTWVFSPIKFQADMGLLLTFMFIWNMIGAIVMIPVLLRVLGHRSAVAVPA
ncbi:MAG: MMPL family transporter [Burkholderiales bacterium]|nr:MMPL family transporter [Burkholderiales bacterium]